ncbi:MAG: DUF6585 family protein [Anaerolineales bacterium]
MDSSQESSNGLGKQISVHKLSFGNKWGTVGAGIFLICLGPILFFGLPLFWSKQGAVMQVELRTSSYLTYLPLFLGAIAILVGMAQLLQVWRNWPQTVTIYEKGLEYVDRKGLRRVFWEDVEELTCHIIRRTYYYFITVGTSYYVAVKTRDGATITFDGRFQKIKKMGDLMQERAASMQLPGYLAKLESGGDIQFGPLKVTKAAVIQGDKLLEWEKVDKFELRNRVLSIAAKGEKWGTWARLNTNEISNPVLLCMIAKKYMGS